MLLIEQFAKENKFLNTTAFFAVTTESGTYVMAAGRIKLQFASSNNMKQMDSADVYRPADVPMRAPKLARATLTCWPRLAKVGAVIQENENLNLPASFHMPETKWITERIIGDRQAPHAVRKALGWIMCGFYGKAGRSATLLWRRKALSSNEMEDGIENFMIWEIITPKHQ